MTVGRVQSAKVIMTLALYSCISISQAGTEEQELKQVQAKIKTVQQRLDSLGAKQDALTKELSQIESRYGKRATALKELNGKLGEKQKEERQIIAKQQSLSLELTVHKDALVEQIRASYLMGQQEPLKLLLNQHDPSRVSRILSYYGYLHRARVEKVNLVQQTAREMNGLRQQLAAEQLRLRRLEKERKQELLLLRELRDSRQKVLAQINAQSSTESQKLVELKADANRLKKLVTEIEAVLGPFPVAPLSKKPFPQMKGQLPWPVGGELSSRYGSERVGAGRWDGIVIKADTGDAVKAVSRGRVAYADWLKGYGLLTILDHGDGYMTLYAFNQSLFKDVGEWVESGESIATVGNSGGRTDPGLYFEIRRRGQPINPSRWLGKKQ